MSALECDSRALVMGMHSVLTPGREFASTMMSVNAVHVLGGRSEIYRNCFLVLGETNRVVVVRVETRHESVFGFLAITYCSAFAGPALFNVIGIVPDVIYRN